MEFSDRTLESPSQIACQELAVDYVTTATHRQHIIYLVAENEKQE